MSLTTGYFATSNSLLMYSNEDELTKLILPGYSAVDPLGFCTHSKAYRH